MLARLDLRGFDGDPGAVLVRPDGGEGPVAAVRSIIAAVRDRGDAALRELTARFDGCEIDELRVPAEELATALEEAAPELRAALANARDAIEAYHETQRGSAGTVVERDGVAIRELVLPVARAGLYVPGGRAAYPSTVLMTAVPARVAGVPEIALCVPPGPDGRVPAATLAAAALVGVDEVYRIGGAQAVAAMAYGTESVRPVDVIVGPGNVYVALAKREVAGIVGIESLAGPSELVVVADEASRADFVAADLMAQAEHGPDGAAVLVTWSEGLADAVDEALDALLPEARRREEIEATLAGGGRTVLVDGPEAAMAVANTIAPEHLQLVNADPESLLGSVRSAGAVFCGPWAPAVLGDYVVGVNHVLPTARTARFASALRVDHFRKHVHVVSVDEAALGRMAPDVLALAAAEGLDAHARSVALREHRR
ncbi:MAG: histidinol dehydrogenase [Acidimicrobiia bacterium]|nr:histidinol dehydrogenase [Acidimicrobiia bacterium]